MRVQLNQLVKNNLIQIIWTNFNMIYRCKRTMWRIQAKICCQVMIRRLCCIQIITLLGRIRIKWKIGDQWRVTASMWKHRSLNTRLINSWQPMPIWGVLSIWVHSNNLNKWLTKLKEGLHSRFKSQRFLKLRNSRKLLLQILAI